MDKVRLDKTKKVTERPDVSALWRGVKAALNLSLSEVVYNTWIAPTRAENLTEDSIDIVCASSHAVEKIQAYKSLIQAQVNEIGQGDYKLNFVVRKPKVKRSTKQKTEPSAKPEIPLFEELSSKTKGSQTNLDTRRKQAGLVPHFTFENFVMGANNQLAYSVAWAVANDPGKQFNPMFLYSGVGLGKTHLMQAIGNHILKTKPELRVVYTTSEQFTNELVETIQAGHQKRKSMTSQFRRKFREADVLLVDDIQFIIGRESTKEEFFHTFNELQLHGKQIVVTSDRPPKDFSNLEERLTSRFGSGIIVDIQKPSIEMRTAILRKMRDEAGDSIPNEIIDFIAARVDTNIRELSGAYLQVVTYIKATGAEMSVETAALALGQIVPEKKSKVNPNEVMNAVCKYFSITKADIKGPRRTKNLVIPRQIAMYLLKEMTGTPLVVIGELLGGRDHTTVLHGANKIEKEIKQTPRLEQDIRNIKQLIYMN